MKNVFKVLAIIALVAVIGFSFTTCSNGNKDDENKVNNPFIGTWESEDGDYTIICTDTTWSIGSSSGTYFHNGYEATFKDSNGLVKITAYITDSGTMKIVDTWSGGTFMLSKSDGSNKTPKIADFNISGTGTVYFDPTVEIKAVTVSAKTGKTTGAVTVFYESADKVTYPKVDSVPIFFGTYNVTFNVEEATGWNEASGLTAGTLIIADGTPSAPTGVNVAIQSLTSLRVSWTSVTRATSYKVYYITEGLDELKLAGTVTTTSFTHSELTLNVDDIYYYYVIAVSDKYGESDYSDFKSIVINKPVAPASVVPSATGSSTIDVRWSSVPGATSYQVFYNTTGESGEKKSWANNTYTGTSCSVQNCSSNTTYYFWVKAVNGFGESDYSPAGSVKTLAGGASNAPTGVKAEMTSSDMIKITWNSISNASRYYVYYTTGSPTNEKYRLGSTSVNSILHYQDLNYAVRPNTTYYYWVTAIYGFTNESGLSEMVTVSTGYTPSPPPIPPTTVTVPPAASTPPSGGGTGQKLCPICYGDGKCSYHYLIYSCDGKGYLDCPKCNGSGTYNKQTCTRCNGKRTIPCDTCHGDGKCRRCNGKGRI